MEWCERESERESESKRKNMHAICFDSSKEMVFTFDLRHCFWCCFPRAARWTLIVFEFFVCLAKFILFSTQMAVNLKSLVPRLVSYSVRSMCCQWKVFIRWKQQMWLNTEFRNSGLYQGKGGRSFDRSLFSNRIASVQLGYLLLRRPILRKQDYV